MHMSRFRDPDIFLQIGATRDGLDPYLREARRRSMTAVLIETPAYLRLRRRLDRQPFDLELGIDDPGCPEAVRAALTDRADRVRLVLGGFERYNACAHAAALALGIPLARDARRRPFLPLDKAAQRAVLAECAPEVAQPGHITIALDQVRGQGHDLAAMIELAQLRYPLVVKPSDGGSGLGVVLVDAPPALAAAIGQLCAMTNSGDGAFSRVVVEELIEGTELSIQAVAFDGAATILTVCDKLIVREHTTAGGGLSGFREAAHIARPGTAADAPLRALAQRCIDAMGYSNGPFHIDAIRNARGLYFVEMGFRLSCGGIVGLVERTTGTRWGELVFAIHLDHRGPAPVPGLPAPDRAVGLVTLTTDAELMFFRELVAGDDKIEVRLISGSTPDDAGDDADPELASDRLRHGGCKARVFLEANDPATIRRRFKQGLHARLAPGAWLAGRD